MMIERLPEDTYILNGPITATSSSPSEEKGKSLFNTFAVQKRSKAEKQYTCHVCPQSFSRPHNLKSHLTTHSSERPYQCDTCKHLFRRHHDLKRHQKLHTGERSHVCHLCFRSFARLDALNRHHRAEGGLACSAVHMRLHSDSSDDTSSSRSATPSSPLSGALLPRPAMTDVCIPSPASPSFEKRQPRTDAYEEMCRGLWTASPTDTHGEEWTENPIKNWLPSPSALSSLPVSDSPDLMPILSPPAHYPRMHQSRILPPLHSPSDPTWVHLVQENEQLKASLAALKAEREQEQLELRLHDLEVENKVLRSLMDSSMRTTTA